jgi:hypothetical protein
VMAIAKGNMAPVLVFAAINDETIKDVALIDGYLSMQSVMLNKHYDVIYVHNSIAGGIQYYDFPDLVAGLAPRNLLLAAKKNPTDNYFSQGNWDKDMEYVNKIYAQKDARDKFRIRNCDEDCNLLNLLAEWMGKKAF